MKRYCRNCFHPLPGKAKFCPQCGQRDADGKVSMKGLLGKLWNNTFHLEGKFLRTAWQLFVPGLVTKEFFKGKQDRYPHPLRLFGIVMFFFLLLLNQRLNQGSNGEGGFHFSVKETAPDTSRTATSDNYMRALEHRAVLEDFRKNYDALPPALHTLQTRQAVDTLSVLFARQHGQPDFSLADTLNDTVRIELINRSFVFSALDIARYEPDELIRRLGATSWIDRIFIRQGIKSLKSPASLGHAYIGSLTWTLLAITTFMAAMLALLYRRQRRYYVEHFIFLLHFHTGALLLLTLGLLLVEFGPFPPVLIPQLLLLIGAGCFFALYRYYGQGIGLTLFKWFIFSLLYAFSTAVFFSLGLFVVFASY